MNNEFKPFHMNAHQDDFVGNNGVGRYILLPGSDGRAKQLAEHFDGLQVKNHARGHNLYIGTIQNGKNKIDVATISSGMGCPSMEIILHELFHLGGKRFLRIGTAGSLQPEQVKIGDLINAQAAVRDENTTIDYAPLSFPAVASLEFNLAVLSAAQRLNMNVPLHTGIVHCKSSFYAREFGAGPLSETNNQFIELLMRYGVIASEMETSALFIQSNHYNHLLKQQGKGKNFQVLSGAILGILAYALPPYQFGTPHDERALTGNLISLGLETIRVLATQENTDTDSPSFFPLAAVGT